MASDFIVGAAGALPWPFGHYRSSTATTLDIAARALLSTIVTASDHTGREIA